MTDGGLVGHCATVLIVAADVLQAPEGIGPRSRTAPSGLTRSASALDFRCIYEEHFDFVWRVARRFGTPDGAVDDVVQDVFLVVYRRLGDFEGRSSIRTWLYGIARRVVADHRKKHRRRPEQPLDDQTTPEAAMPAGARPDVRAERAEAVALLHEILDELSDEHREVFVLAELEQLTAPQIVELTGIKLNTVYSRLRLARTAFERALRQKRVLRDAQEAGSARGDAESQERGR